MPKFNVTETVACWVEFNYTIEAENKEEALLLYNEGQSDFVSCDVGDNIDWVDANEPVIVEESKP